VPDLATTGGAETPPHKAWWKLERPFASTPSSDVQLQSEDWGPKSDWWAFTGGELRERNACGPFQIGDLKDCWASTGGQLRSMEAAARFSPQQPGLSRADPLEAVPFDLKGYGAARLERLGPENVATLCRDRGLPTSGTPATQVQALLLWKVDALKTANAATEVRLVIHGVRCVVGRIILLLSLTRDTVGDPGCALERCRLARAPALLVDLVQRAGRQSCWRCDPAKDANADTHAVAIAGHACELERNPHCSRR
jgi:hypothetical protein